MAERHDSPFIAVASCSMNSSSMSEILSDNALSSPPLLTEESSLEGIPVAVPIPVRRRRRATESDSTFGRPKRKRSYSSPGRSTLPSQLSRWKRKHAQKLHIFYEKKHSQGLEDLKQKMNGTIHDLNAEQKEYTNFVFKYLTVQLGMENFSRHNQVNASTAEEEIALVEENIKNINTKETKLSWLELLAKEQILDFICALRNLLYEMRNYERENQLYPAAEGFLNGFIASFARLCYLRAVDCTGKTAYHSVWENLNRTSVTSEPDLRLYKYGLERVFSNTLVSVVEVIKPKYSYNIDLMPPPKKKYQGSPRNSPVVSGTEVAMSEDSDAIELDLHDKVLGRHAGQLLLDLHEKFRESEPNDYEENRIMNMLGMIVEGSAVFFTMLEITWKHYQKLKHNVSLESEDKATIYYTKSKDILRERDRKVLIESLFSLNNIDFY